MLRPVNPMAYLAAVARAFRSKDRAGSSSGPTISGKVTDAHGKPLAGICVGANQVGTGGGPPPTGPGVRTGRNGTYRMSGRGLNPGRWKVAFMTGCGNKGDFAPQWWKFAATENKAKVLVLHSHTHLTAINARLAKGASISGTVRAGSKSGPGLPGACVTAEGLGGASDQYVQTKTGHGGKYLITGLGTGRYRVFFDAGCGNKGNFTGDPISPIVSVTDGKTTKGVDGFLPLAGEISGTVTTGADHRPLAGICVEGSSDSGGVGSFFGTETGPTGQYEFSGVAPGRYEVDFAAGCGSKGSFAPQFYKNQVSQSAANPVLIKAGKKAGGIDAVMQPGGTVTGTVTSVSGKRLAGVCVLLDRQTEDTGAEFDILIGGGDTGALAFGAIARTVSGGRYRVTDLLPGNYAVSFTSGCGRHELVEGSQWFSPQGGDRMRLLTVGTGTVSGINAKLPAPGTITGVVTGPTGKPVGGVCVFPDSLTGQPDNTLVELLTSGNFGETNKQGGYRLTGLAAGKYGLQFAPCRSQSLATQWYRQVTEFSGLTPVVVRSGHVKAGVDEKMLIGQSVSGRITRAGSSQPVANA
ncbi:MAG TPA: carboxypeptidase-like regulatory domain-containing protein, partial [Streptosporangiaceae bacterium]|nr:carboxypeptidase-like regulatory domain-containing protein [Streptosporangiaceae bacterium]